MPPPTHWLMKAEPDSRVVKGKDVKFSVDDFEAINVTPWEGVRNAEARNLMKEMAIGDKVLFYHSNCKTPGIAAFAEVSKEAYPDFTAWDPEHPYHDPKTDKHNPKWFMVDVTFRSRLAHFIPLSFLRSIADLPQGADPPEEVNYIGRDGVKQIKEMPLVKRGRLSVQRVSENVWPIIQQLGERGGFENTAGSKAKPKVTPKSRRPKASTSKGEEKQAMDDEEEASNEATEEDEVAEALNPETEAATQKKGYSRKRKAPPEVESGQGDGAPVPLRRSTRTRR